MSRAWTRKPPAAAPRLRLRGTPEVRGDAAWRRRFRLRPAVPGAAATLAASNRGRRAAAALRDAAADVTWRPSPRLGDIVVFPVERGTVPDGPTK